MTWFYSQSTGELSRDGLHVGAGYSGIGAGLNNPAMQAEHDVGPIPTGGWIIGAPLDPPDHLGPIAMPLTPAAGNAAFGRSAFFMHGDNHAANHTASNGCIIMGPAIRRAVRDSGDRGLTVTV